jgi:hypothetical protein
MLSTPSKQVEIMTHTLSQSPTAPRYALQVRVHPAFAAALKTVADRDFMPVSVFVRHVLIERLRAAGIDPAALIGTDDVPAVAGMPRQEIPVS